AVWCVTLVLVLLLPAMPPQEPRRPRVAPPVAQQAVRESSPVVLQAVSAPVPRLPGQVSIGRNAVEMLTALWALAFLWHMGRIVRTYFYLRGIKRRAHPVSDARQSIFERWLAACRIRRRVRLLMSAEISSPIAAGFLRPAVILPESLLEDIDGDELDQV